MGKIFYAEFQRLDKRALFQIVLETKWLVYETGAKIYAVQIDTKTLKHKYL